jgi:hypothetical protein
MPSKKMKIVFVVASGLLLLESRAMAQQGGVAKTCDGEIRTLCPDVQPGRGRLRECIKSRETELSGPCRATVERLAAVVNACAADRKKLCADVKPVGSRVRECLKSHMGDLGDACKAAIAKAVTGNK